MENCDWDPYVCCNNKFSKEGGLRYQVILLTGFSISIHSWKKRLSSKYV